MTGADQTLVLENGRVIESGRHDELLQANGRYARLWQTQQVNAFHAHGTEEAAL